MASTYKTPGVYVEEISKFPPSIASVETAIPAFIGYTEWAKKKETGDLLRKPVRITAIADYELFFGGPDMELGFKAEIKDIVDEASKLLSRTVTVPVPANLSKFLLYYSVRLYFANGGGPCYIISVGNYKDGGGATTTISADDLGNNSAGNGGLDVLALEDEPTLILFPDAQALPQPKYYSLCQAALAQCNKLQDRFAILDTLGQEDTAPSLFRDFIGTEYLKYGAVYYPFLDTSLSYAYRETEVDIHQSMALTFNLTSQLVTDISTEKGKIDTAITAITAIDVNTPVGLVTAPNPKATKIAALPPIKTTSDLIKAQIDIITASVQTITSKTNAFNARFMDPDVSTAINNIDSTVYANYSGALERISQAVTDAIAAFGAAPASISIAEIDAIATDLSTLVANGAPTKDLLENLTDLKDNLIPALVTATQGNDPASMITQVNTGYSNSKNARAALEAIDTGTLVSTVTGAAISDASALAALQGGVRAGNTTITSEIGNLKTALTSILAATKNASQISFLQGLLSSLKFIDLNNIDAIHAKFTTIDTGITGATAATLRADLDKLANDFGAAMSDLARETTQIFSSLGNLVNAINYLNIDGKKLSEIKQIDNHSYNQIKQEIDRIPVKLPPSSAVAGKYAQVDRDRGVWKAPANVSLASVIGPSRKVNNDIQDGLNVDPVAGKSINAIRVFTGKGTMVWGARTLSGNDNEWRYVSVRRFFIYAEESVKKACDHFVFEPNDANTWVKVSAMIENWLTLQWRAGALAGAKPDDAFYVRIGLGQTMTAVDILEGRMNVEIGMAVVRPAEFIILKFSHKMQES